MIIYLDTSTVVKLFAEEAESELVRRTEQHARLVITHLINYAETCAGFARKARDTGNPVLFGEFKNALDRQWPYREILQADERLIRWAAEVPHIRRLRGYNRVHLAAAEPALARGGDPATFAFAVFDKQLRRGACDADFRIAGE